MTDKVYIPPIKTQGIKTKIVPLIKNNAYLSEKSVWIEPFMGSGVVGFNVAPSTAIFADINPHIIAFYNQIKEGNITSRCVRDFLEKEGKLLSKDGDAYYYEVRQRFNQKHDPLDFLFLNRSCFNGVIRFNKSFEFNVPYGHKPQRFSKAYITKIVNQLAHVEQLFKKNSWFFLCQSFEQTINMADKNSFIYCDPPYIGRHVDYYDSWNEELEIFLCEALRTSNAKFMLSTWDHNDYRKNEYIEKIWSFCNKLTHEHFYHVGAKETNRNSIMEALLTNYVTTGNSNLMVDRNKQIAIFDFDDATSM
ncbi:MAG: Dam family site-specific DNA-(adenine-N6)-methyltransferase [Firmicutes bacterium]|nr:Dam family site-specific DNA-(adenine-N6)-methyltransferase [Bacillota bacterium]